MSTKIYTKTGDKGKTSLFDGTRVSKDNLRLETYGTFDEVSSILGIAQSFLRDSRFKIQDSRKLILLSQSIQKDLLDMGAYLANPNKNPSKKFIAYLDQRVSEFEKSIDAMTQKLPPLTNFILFTGNTPSSFLQQARSVARRAERRLVGLSRAEVVDGAYIRYFNRLSDLLYTMGRFMDSPKGRFKKRKKEVIWTPFT